MSTGVSIDVAKWDFRKQRAKGYSQDAKILNQWLEDLNHLFDETFFEFRKNGEQTSVPKFKKRLLEKMGKNNNGAITLINFWELRLEEMKFTKAKNTVRNFRLSLNRLLKFNPNLNFNDIDLIFYNNFINYMYAQDYATNYVAKVLSNLCKIMDDAFERDLHQNFEYKKKSFKNPAAKTDKIVLNNEEIEAIYKTQNLSATEVLKRDLFIFACYTGLRYSDWGKINFKNVTEHENGLKILTIETQKTKSIVSIPLNFTCIEILNRYGGGFELMSNQKVNTGLKVICKKTGLTKQTIERIFTGNTVKVKEGELWEFVACHTARRSFVTNCIKAGIERPAIMKMTGHSNEKAFKKYDKETALENALKIANYF
jgi:site-specific recombinase XerD